MTLFREMLNSHDRRKPSWTRICFSLLLLCSTGNAQFGEIASIVTSLLGNGGGAGLGAAGTGASLGSLGFWILNQNLDFLINNWNRLTWCFCRLWSCQCSRQYRNLWVVFWKIRDNSKKEKCLHSIFPYPSFSPTNPLTIDFMEEKRKTQNFKL